MAIADGTSARPADEKARETWDTNDALTKLAILTAIDAGQHEYACSAKTAATMWSNLLAVYERVDSAKKINVLREHHHYTYDGTTMAKHIARIKNLAQQCDTVGEAQSESNILAELLDGLPDRFNVVITSWEIVPEQQQTRVTLKRMLLEAKARSSDVTAAEQALTVSKPTAKNTSKQGKDKKNKKDSECFKYHKKGHYAWQCRTSQPKKSTDESTKSNNELTASTGPSCFVVRSSENSKQSWIADSGTSCHMVNNRNYFSDFTPWSRHWRLLILRARLWLQALEIRKNLFSVGAVTRRGVTSHTHDDRMVFKRNRKVELEAFLTDKNMFLMAIRKPTAIEANVADDLKTWHDRLGHISIKHMQEMTKNGMLPGLKIDSNTQLVCEACMYGKMSKLPFDNCEKRTFAAGEMWHSDVNTMPVESWSGHCYYINLVDDATGFCYVHFMKHKDEIL